MHWHGIQNKGTSWYDGVPSVSQCPIAPGSSFTYTFKADAYGSSWYHSHYSAQYTAGVFGPLIVYGPKHVPYDIDLGPVMLGDHYHRDYFAVLQSVTTPKNDFDTYVPKADNNLINGRNSFDCSLGPPGSACTPNATLSKFRFRRGKTHKLRLMNIGAAAFVKFSIDGHKLNVIANDFTPIEPYEADYVSLSVGQRVDVLVGPPASKADAYWVRSSISMNCSAARISDARAIVLYDDADEMTVPQTSPGPAFVKANDTSFVCQNVWNQAALKSSS